MRRAGDQIARELAKDFAVPARDLPAAVRGGGHKDHRGSRHSGSPMVTINFNGTQRPDSEQMASIKRELTMALGGA
jgi:hypothetical protein